MMLCNRRRRTEMDNKNTEVVNENNYSITDRNRPVKKKRRIFGTIVALVISLLLALILRYYIEVSGRDAADNETCVDDGKQTAVLDGSLLL